MSARKEDAAAEAAAGGPLGADRLDHERAASLRAAAAILGIQLP